MLVGRCSSRFGSLVLARQCCSKTLPKTPVICEQRLILGRHRTPGLAVKGVLISSCAPVDSLRKPRSTPMKFVPFVSSSVVLAVADMLFVICKDSDFYDIWDVVVDHLLIRFSGRLNDKVGRDVSFYWGRANVDGNEEEVPCHGGTTCQ